MQITCSFCGGARPAGDVPAPAHACADGNLRLAERIPARIGFAGCSVDAVTYFHNQHHADALVELSKLTPPFRHHTGPAK